MDIHTRIYANVDSVMRKKNWRGRSPSGLAVRVDDGRNRPMREQNRLACVEVHQPNLDIILVATPTIHDRGFDGKGPVLHPHHRHIVGAGGRDRPTSGHRNLTVQLAHGLLLRLGAGGRIPGPVRVSLRDAALPVAAAVAANRALRGVDGGRTGRGPHAPPLPVNFHRLARVGEAAEGDEGQRSRGRFRRDPRSVDHLNVVPASAGDDVVPHPDFRGRGRGDGGRGADEERADDADDTLDHGNLQGFRISATHAGGAPCIRTAPGAGSPLCRDSERLCRRTTGGHCTINNGYGMHVTLWKCHGTVISMNGFPVDGGC